MNQPVLYAVKGVCVNMHIMYLHHKLDYAIKVFSEVFLIIVIHFWNQTWLFIVVVLSRLPLQEGTDAQWKLEINSLTL